MALSVAPDRRRRELARLTVLQSVQPRAKKKRNEARWRHAHNNLGGVGFRAPQFGGDDAERARNIARGIKATGGDGPAGRIVGHRRGRGRPVAPRTRHHELLGPAGGERDRRRIEDQRCESRGCGGGRRRRGERRVRTYDILRTVRRDTAAGCEYEEGSNAGAHRVRADRCDRSSAHAESDGPPLRLRMTSDDSSGVPTELATLERDPPRAQNRVEDD